MGVIMKTTRMRMTKEAAAIIHDYRDGHGHKTNSDAVYGLISDLDVANCDEVFMSRQVAELEAENGRLKRFNCLIKKSSDERTLAYKGQIKSLDESLEQKCALIDILRADRKWGLDQISELEKQIERIESFRMMWKGAAMVGWVTLLMVCAGLLAHMIIIP